MTVTTIVAINILLNTESIVTKNVSPFVDMSLFANQHVKINGIVTAHNGETVVNNGVTKDGTATNNGVKKRIDCY